MNPIEALGDEARLLWQVLLQRAAELPGGEKITPGQRAVLELLLSHGPATVPRIARARRVTRQHVQALVNSLLALRMVTLQTNPEHRRSRLVQLTSAGAKLCERMRRRERALFDPIARSTQAGEIERAVKTLRKVRGALERRNGC